MRSNKFARYGIVVGGSLILGVAVAWPASLIACAGWGILVAASFDLMGGYDVMARNIEIKEIEAAYEELAQEVERKLDRDEKGMARNFPYPGHVEDLLHRDELVLELEKLNPQHPLVVDWRARI